MAWRMTGKHPGPAGLESIRAAAQTASVLSVPFPAVRGFEFDLSGWVESVESTTKRVGAFFCVRRDAFLS